MCSAAAATWQEFELIFALCAGVCDIQADFQNYHIWVWNLAIGQSSRSWTYTPFLSHGVEIKLIFALQAAVSEIWADFPNCHTWAWNFAIGQSSRRCKIWNFENWIFNEFYSLSLTWDPMGKFWNAIPTNCSQKFWNLSWCPPNGPHKTAFGIFEILTFWVLTIFFPIYQLDHCRLWKKQKQNGVKFDPRRWVFSVYRILVKLSVSGKSGVIRCISDFQQPCISKTEGLRVKDTSKSLCYPVLCGHCLPSCQGERQSPWTFC